MFEDRLRERVVFPTDFRVPLNSKDKVIGSCIYDSFHQPIGRFGDRFQILAKRVDALMMVAVDANCGAACENCEQAFVLYLYAVGRTIVRSLLLVLYHSFDL